VKLALYARASDANGDENSIADQFSVGHFWADEHGHEIVSEHADDAVRGELAHDERPGLAAALVDIERGKADGLLVRELGRFARSLHVQEAALAHAWSIGPYVKVFEAHGGEVQRDDPDDPMRRFIRQVLGAINELDKSMQVARMRRGKRRVAAAGGYIGGQRLHPKFGYRLMDGEYVPDPSEQETLDRIAALRTGPPKLSWRGVCEALTAEGVRPPSGSEWFPATARKLSVRERGVS
jgi:DNA invertase Pin-like site-specific DNA recombinase